MVWLEDIGRNKNMPKEVKENWGAVKEGLFHLTVPDNPLTSIVRYH